MTISHIKVYNHVKININTHVTMSRICYIPFLLYIALSYGLLNQSCWQQLTLKCFQCYILLLVHLLIHNEVRFQNFPVKIKIDLKQIKILTHIIYKITSFLWHVLVY